MDQEEIVNPVGLCGDLMKAFRHQAIPGLDSIFQYGRGSPMYKIVSSAAHNYDRELVMTEVFGAMGEGIGVPTLYREAMDELAKGINWIVPHAIWYDAGQVGRPARALVAQRRLRPGPPRVQRIGSAAARGCCGAGGTSPTSRSSTRSPASRPPTASASACRTRAA